MIRAAASRIVKFRPHNIACLPAIVRSRGATYKSFSKEYAASLGAHALSPDGNDIGFDYQTPSWHASQNFRCSTRGGCADQR